MRIRNARSLQAGVQTIAGWYTYGVPEAEYARLFGPPR